MGFKLVVITDRQLMDDLNSYTMNWLSLFPKLWCKTGLAARFVKRLLCLVYPNATDPRPMHAVHNSFHAQFGGNLHTFFDAPCAILVVPHELHISDPEVGVGIVCENMVLAAHSLGLGTCYVGLVTNAVNKDRKTRKRFEKVLGLQYPFKKAGMFVLLGYPAVKVDGAVSRDFPPVEWL
jgi:nitroreductase